MRNVYIGNHNLFYTFMMKLFLLQDLDNRCCTHLRTPEPGATRDEFAEFDVTICEHGPKH